MEMLLIYRNILAGARRHSTMEDTQRLMACLEACVIHLRVLLAFLYDYRGQDTGAIAEDFIESARIRDWTRARPKKTANLLIAASRAGTQVAHLSYRRKEMDPWDLQQLTDAMIDRLRIFVQHADPKRLDPSIGELFQILASPPIDMSRLPVGATIEDLARIAAERPGPIQSPASGRSEGTTSTTTVISMPSPTSAYGSRTP